MLPLGDCDLWLYLHGIFICIAMAFTTNNYFSPLCVFFFFNAAVLVVLIIKLQTSVADKADTSTRLAALTPPPQTRRHRESVGLQCMRLADISPCASRCCRVAWQHRLSIEAQ